MIVVNAGYVNAIEISLAAAAVWGAFFSRRGAGRISRGPARVSNALKGVSLVWRGVLIALLPITIRLVLLPWMPVPVPAVQEEFSNLLEADTFAHGRLANPPHPMSVFFDNVQEIQYPNYVSARLPGTAVFLWAGQEVFREPWAGNCVVVAAMCAAVYWMLLGWTRPRWAWFCALLFALRFGIFTYWINSYWPASPAALGGALILGAAPRLRKSVAVGHAALFAGGAVILLLNRPVEGAVFTLPAVLWIVSGWRADGRKTRVIDIAVRAILPASAILAACFGWMLYYNAETTGKATQLAYTIWRKGQADAPTFWWQPLGTAHLVYYSRETWRFFHHFEDGIYTALNASWHARLRTLLWRVVYFSNPELGFVFTLAMLFPLTGIRAMRESRWIRIYFLAMSAAAAGFMLSWRFNMLPVLLIPAAYAFAFLAAARNRFGRYILPVSIVLLGLSLRLLTVFSMPNYYPEFIPPAILLAAEGFRRMYVWRRARRIGAAMTRNLLIAGCGMVVVHAAIPVFGIHLQGEDPFYMHSYENRLLDRQNVERFLESRTGPQLAIVRYAADHDELLEWVWNGAAIDSQKVIWAREQSPEWMPYLLRYYRARSVWLVEPDATPVRITPYRAVPATDLADPPPKADYIDHPPGRSCVFLPAGTNNCK